MDTARRRLENTAAALAHAATEELTALTKQRPDMKTQNDHASSQSVSYRTVSDQQLFLMDTKVRAPGCAIVPTLLRSTRCCP